MEVQKNFLLNKILNMESIIAVMSLSISMIRAYITIMVSNSKVTQGQGQQCGDCVGGGSWRGSGSRREYGG